MSRKFNPKVSIVIPVYNGSNYMREAIDSALSQTYKNLEVIVVNDGSTDGGKTDKIALSYGDKIKYFKKENGGVATALNLAIKNMTGTYFSWLSHDDVYFPTKIEKQIDFLSKLEDKNAVLYCNVQYIDKRSKSIYSTAYELKHSDRELNNGLFCMLNGYANGCALLIPKLCFDKVGYFNEKSKTANDYEMWSRIFREFDVKFLPNVLIKYRLHQGQDTNTSPVYDQESDQMWKEIIANLKENELLGFTDDLFNFYFDIAFRMKAAKWMKAYTVANKKAEEHYKTGKRKVSIIMPCFNTVKYLSKAIDSILNQTFYDFELIIVDDGSTDGSIAVIKDYVKKDYRVVFTKNLKEKGIAGAMNTGLSMASGQYLTRMDSDDISLPTRIEEQVRFLDKNSSYGVCSVNISKIDVSDKVTLDSLFEMAEAPLEWLFLWENPISNAPTMYRNELITKYKVKFNQLKTAEDYDFLCNIVIHTKVYQINEPLYQYRIHGESVYQKNYYETISNSVRINKKLIGKLTDDKIPNYHHLLTVFKSDKDKIRNINYIECSKWMEVLLKASKRTWNWNEEEYKLALEDANRRIYKYITLIYEEERAAKALEDAKNKPLVKKVLFSIKYHGLFFTIKHCYKKVKEKF